VAPFLRVVFGSEGFDYGLQAAGDDSAHARLVGWLAPLDFGLQRLGHFLALGGAQPSEPRGGRNGLHRGLVPSLAKRGQFLLGFEPGLLLCLLSLQAAPFLRLLVLQPFPLQFDLGLRWAASSSRAWASASNRSSSCSSRWSFVSSRRARCSWSQG
jgi:hypothetical protein